MGKAKVQYQEAMEAEASEDYLMSRLRDNDATIERMIKQVASMKHLLMRTHDWLEFWEMRMPAGDRFDSEQLRATIAASQRLNVDDS